VSLLGAPSGGAGLQTPTFNPDTLLGARSLGTRLSLCASGAYVPAVSRRHLRGGGSLDRHKYREGCRLPDVERTRLGRRPASPWLLMLLREEPGRALRELVGNVIDHATAEAAGGLKRILATP
jgi:hypothetical protein